MEYGVKRSIEFPRKVSCSLIYRMTCGYLDQDENLCCLANAEAISNVPAQANIHHQPF